MENFEGILRVFSLIYWIHSKFINNLMKVDTLALDEEY